MGRTSPGGSSTSRTRRSPRSRRSAWAPSGSASPGSGRGEASGGPIPAGEGGPPGGLSRRVLQDLARRHGIRPKKALGQHFLADPNLARAIAREAGAAPGQRILEVGAGLGSLTVALAAAGADVLAVELDRALLPALEEVAAGWPGIRVVRADAVTADWRSLLGEDRWRMASNLPYNVAVPVVAGLLEGAPAVDPLLVMVQREVGERLAASPGEAAYGAVSLRVAYRASARIVRRVPASVFWPQPQVESVLVRLERRPPPVDLPPGPLFRLVEEGFAQRRKTMANALVRMGYSRERARAALEGAGLDARVRAEDLGLEDLARLVDALGG